ncbi:hypothetical protein [Plantactinospora sp. CA-290183]|uniref:hypothetical protein n=1 Tax=Plantactinospora sp. CA-290183 TaxID=3240006 RepID=UPI003D8EBA61
MRTLPTPCARDGKGPGHQYGLPDLIEPAGSRHALLPTPTAASAGSNRSTSAGAARRPSLPQLVREHLLPTPTAGGGTGYLSGNKRDTWRPTPETAVQGCYLPSPNGKPDRPQSLLPTPTAADSRSSANATAGRSGQTGHAGRTHTDAARLLPTPRATDGFKGCPGQRGSHGDLTLPSAAVRFPVRSLPTPTGSDGRGPGRHGTGGADLRSTIAELPHAVPPDEARWGGYAAAVARWETLLGRPAPEPTQIGRHGRPVLAPPFVEWLMGLDPHWVTDPELDLPRTLALKVLGNGVVPQQAAAALRLLLCPYRWAVSR